VFGFQQEETEKTAKESPLSFLCFLLLEFLRNQTETLPFLLPSSYLPCPAGAVGIDNPPLMCQKLRALYQVLTRECYDEGNC
jgi:hypothetical protein